jgi:hypothetical protein
MNRDDHERYLNGLLEALVELGGQRVAQAQWMLQQNGLPDRQQQARAWERSGRKIIEHAGWALDPANHAIRDDTPGQRNKCRFQDGTTVVIHRPIHPMCGPEDQMWLHLVLTRPDSQPRESSPDLWIPFLLTGHNPIRRHVRIIAPWIADAILP